MPQVHSHRTLCIEIQMCVCTCISCAQSMEGIMCHITPTKTLYIYVHTHTHTHTHTGLRAVNGGGDVPLHGRQPSLLHQSRPGLVGLPPSTRIHTHTHTRSTYTHTHTHMYIRIHTHTHTAHVCIHTHTHTAHVSRHTAGCTNRKRTWFHVNPKPDTHSQTCMQGMGFCS
jgi:hypothetical protein